MTEPVTTREVAEAEFDRFAEAMDLDVDTDKLDAEDKTAFEKQKERLIKATMAGHLVYNEDGEPVYTPHHRKTKHKEPITFHERSGASMMAMDRTKKNHDMAKTYAIMADITGLHSHTFASMFGVDVKTCEAIFALLMD